MIFWPGRILARAALVAFATTAAWGQLVEPSVVPQVPVGAGTVGVAPLAGAVSALRLALSLPASVGIARSVALGVNPTGVRLSPVSRAALAVAEGSSLSHLSDLATRVSALGGSDRSREFGRTYDRSRRLAAQPLAAAASNPGGPSGPTGRELLDRVEELAKRGHKSVGYDDARIFMFSKGHQTRRNGRPGVLEVYTQTFVAGTSGNGRDYRGAPGGEFDRDGMNAEHVWPQSFFAKKAPMRSDLYNLLPTFVHPNSLRGHMPFGEVVGRPEYSNRAGAKLGGGVFEPPPAAKGQIARSILYFVARYRDDAVRQGHYSENFFNKRVEMFLRWNREHPPTGAERATNDLNAREQGNRNPFVDDPSLADRIGVAGFRFDPERPGRPTHKEYFDFRPTTSHVAIIQTTGMRSHRDERRRSRSNRGPASRHDGRRKKR